MICFLLFSHYTLVDRYRSSWSNYFVCINDGTWEAARVDDILINQKINGPSRFWSCGWGGGAQKS